jgi:outer membrane receptor protein involved in Fe transport
MRQWTFAAQGRAAGRQFDDDLNLFPLDSMFDLDVFAARRISPMLEIYFAAENALDQRYMVGRTPTPTWGPPILFRIGARVSVGSR